MHSALSGRKSMVTRPDPPITKLAVTVQFAFLLAVSGVLWWRSLISTLELALSDEAYTHILLILPLSCALIYLERKIHGPELMSSVGSGGLLLGVALLIAAFGRWGTVGIPEDVQLSLGMLALVIWWIGSFIVCFGTRTFQALFFPLCLLLWLIPLPVVPLDGIIHFLQQQSAFAARIMFLAAGVPVTQDGV